MLCFLETRFCLALLYGHLFQYQLTQALGLCEHLAQQLVPRPRLEGEGGAEAAGTYDHFLLCVPGEKVYNMSGSLTTPVKKHPVGWCMCCCSLSGCLLAGTHARSGTFELGLYALPPKL